MPKLTAEEQRELGTAVARLLTPMPNDERLLLLVACLYGEGMNQGLTTGELVAFADRIMAVHAQGVHVASVRFPNCPLCGARTGAL